MGNIRNHNHFPFDLTPVKSDYWDFFLYLYQCGWSGFGDWYYTGCLAAMIDTTIDECVTDDGLESLGEYVYSKCKSNGLELNNIGFTGTDNGFLIFDRDTIKPEEFVELVKNSKYVINEGDCKLKLRPIGGNNKIFDYSWSMVDEDGMRCARLNGGFFQGIYAAGDTCEYSVLPNKIGDEGWSLDFVLKPMNFGNACYTLNSRHPENTGIFFYMGARAENKWLKYYDTGCVFDEIKQNRPDAMLDYVQHVECLCDLDDCAQTAYYPDNYLNNTDCACANYFKDNYMEVVERVEESANIEETNSKHALNETNFIEIETDNKYAFFDRSCDGVTVKTYEDGDNALIQYRNIKNDANYFTLFSRACDGLTVRDYGKYIDENGNKYDVYKDLYRNAFALQIKPDGSVGYKYFVCNTDNGECSYNIESEFTKPGNAPYGKWANIHVRVNKLHHSNKMRLMIYVNGKLRLVSKELQLFNFKELDDTSDKQEGVPYNISVGGGTQGLSDVVYNEYTKLPDHIYPLEKEFGGTFEGYIKSFKFYECSINYNNLNQNYITFLNGLI